MTGRSDDIDDYLAQLIPAGFPTFDEFKKNPDKFRLGRYQLFESVQNSTTIDRKQLAKQKMYWRYGKHPIGFNELERIVVEEGYKLEDIEVMPYRAKNDSGTGKDVVYVRFFPKVEIQLMGGVIPNDEAA